MNLMRAALPQMRSRAQGVIINVASLGGFFPLAGNSVYGGTKAFLIMLTESLHLELKGSGIRVQVIAPGFGYKVLRWASMYVPRRRLLPLGSYTGVLPVRRPNSSCSSLTCLVLLLW